MVQVQTNESCSLKEKFSLARLLPGYAAHWICKIGFPLLAPPTTSHSAHRLYILMMSLIITTLFSASEKFHLHGESTWFAVEIFHSSHFDVDQSGKLRWETLVRKKKSLLAKESNVNVTALLLVGCYTRHESLSGANVWFVHSAAAETWRCNVAVQRGGATWRCNVAVCGDKTHSKVTSLSFWWFKIEILLNPLKWRIVKKKFESENWNKISSFVEFLSLTSDFWVIISIIWLTEKNWWLYSRLQKFKCCIYPSGECNLFFYIRE